MVRLSMERRASSPVQSNAAGCQTGASGAPFLSVYNLL